MNVNTDFPNFPLKAITVLDSEFSATIISLLVASDSHEIADRYNWSNCAPDGYLLNKLTVSGHVKHSSQNAATIVEASRNGWNYIVFRRFEVVL